MENIGNMKLFVHTILLLTLLTPLCLKAQKRDAEIRTEPTEVQLGEIQLSKIDDMTGRVTIKIFNDGEKPLILQKVSGCCGTDIKEYTKAPILPSKNGEIQVYFRVEPKLQAISRTVTIVSNAKNSKELQVHIKGTVVKDKEKGRIAF